MERLGSAAMKKITELDGARLYAQTGTMPWERKNLNREWLERAFTPAQRRFLEKHRYTARPHPKHSPTIEIFINEHTLQEQEYTMMRLLF